MVIYLKNASIITTLLASLWSGVARAQMPGDYLVLQSIEDYRTSGKGKCYKGPGLLGGVEHFDEDHDDFTCSSGYYNAIQDIAVSIKITQHTASDSDKWLLHELDREFRSYYGNPGKSYGPRQINGQTILENLVAGGSYRWLSGNKVVVVEYHEAQMTKPEPVEVIQAYLVKHPSTILAFTLEDLRSAAHRTKWIKDEIDRRLWLCDKWFAQFSAGKTDQKTALEASVKSMTIFINYREKYNGISAKDEKNLLSDYLEQNNISGIQTKLAEYKTWWNTHKSDTITLP